MRAKEKYQWIAQQFKEFANENKYDFNQDGFSISVNDDCLDEYTTSYSMKLYPDNRFLICVGNAMMFIPSRQVKKFLIKKDIIKINEMTLMENN